MEIAHGAPPAGPQLLQSFVAIVETGSFTRAAERIHLTQSTLSQQMRRLEQQLGCTLLDRSGRQVVTTAQGRPCSGWRAASWGCWPGRGAGERASHPCASGCRRILPRGHDPGTGRLRRAHPQVRLEVQSDLSHAWQAFEGGAGSGPHQTGGAARGAIARWRRPGLS